MTAFGELWSGTGADKAWLRSRLAPIVGMFLLAGCDRRPMEPIPGTVIPFDKVTGEKQDMPRTKTLSRYHSRFIETTCSRCGEILPPGSDQYADPLIPFTFICAACVTPAEALMAVDSETPVEGEVGMDGRPVRRS